MERRTARLRKEYLLSKAHQTSKAGQYEHGMAVHNSAYFPDASPQPNNGTTSSQQTAYLRRHGKKDALQDDEYTSLSSPPKLLLTTSRKPSSRLSQFVKELKHVFPNTERINRGATTVSDLVKLCRSYMCTDLIVVHEHRGKPDGLIVCHMPYGPTVTFGICNTVLRHDLNDSVSTMSGVSPHVIFDNFSSPLGIRVKAILRHLFPYPRLSSRRVITFSSNGDGISFRHHIYKQQTDSKSIFLSELGPRFELRLYQIKLGTLDENEASVEYCLKPFMRSGKSHLFTEGAGK
mmetsp:Transcript_3304/g.11464  ORF Transcript_3304/g.11464 Transcript_3304/m.11464 type:complete len:291 (+) Transcript_3304:161-1033(+)